MRAVTILVGLATVALFQCSGEEGKPPSPPLPPGVGLDNMLSFEKLPFLRSGARAYQFSSTNPDGVGYDEGHYLAGDGAEETMFDAEGPGVIYRFWHTSAFGGAPYSEWSSDAESGQYMFYFDGATTPTWTVDRSQFWSTTLAPFLAPLTRGPRPPDGSGGYVTYLPIPFAKSLRITTRGQHSRDFYNITYTTYGNGADVTSFTGTEDASAVNRMWNDVGLNPIPSRPTDRTISGKVNVGPLSTVRLAELEGPGELVELKLRLDHALDLDDVHLQIAWDGEKNPSVDAPISRFFLGGPSILTSVKALPIGNEDGTLYCYFPMPFAHSATIEITNSDEALTLEHVSYSLTHRGFPDAFGNVANFHAVYMRPHMTMVGLDDTLLEYSGSGQYVGVNVELPRPGRALEGNERIYVDGVRSPTIQGTGTEDFFNGGWYFGPGAFSTQTYGAPNVRRDASSFSAYRFNLSDAIPFSSSIRVALAHNTSDMHADAPYGSVAYFYATPRPLAVKTDDLDVGDAVSEEAHHYVTSGTPSRMTLAARFYSDDPNRVTDVGRESSGTSTFSVAIGAENDGVVLRRLYDQAAAQVAAVTVDGQTVGVWKNPWSSLTFRWAESDFWIPRSATAGKSSLSITITPVAGTWTEFRYQALTQLVP